jgi:hypothetical protein
MRKILLGTTAVVSAVMGAAVMAPQASAQEAPTVRIGGFIQSLYGYTNQTSQQSMVSAGAPNGTGLPTGVGGSSAAVPTSTTNIARSGKHDIASNAGIDVIVNGKLANGMTYGGVISLNSNGLEGRQIVGSRSSLGKTAVQVDEMYAFIAHPRFGQVRMGDEDGVMGGLMNSGWVQGFGTGGVHGSWEAFVMRQSGGRTTTAPGGLGDASKILYMSPQFAGFDFGASFAPNYNSGAQSGCPNEGVSGYCDRVYAFSGARGVGIPAAGGDYAVRRNEYQLAARWRGNVSGVGVAATVGYIGAGAVRDMTNSGQQFRVFNDLSIWQVGVQASYAGFTLGANYSYGDFNFFWGNTLRGDRPAEQLVIGGQYVAGPITVGANFVTGLFEGGSRTSFNENTTTVNGNAPGTLLVQSTPRPGTVGTTTNAAGMRRWGLGVGANYRLAPGMDLIAEYVYYSVREQGRDLDTIRPGIQSRAFSNVFMTGVRLAF